MIFNMFSFLQSKLPMHSGAWKSGALATALAVLTAGPLAAAPRVEPCAGQDQRATLSADLKAAVAAEIAQAPYPEGLYWTATRGDRVLHVIGTLHLNDPRFAHWQAALAATLDGADALLVEATKADQARVQTTLAKDLSIAFITEGPSLIDRLSPEEWDHVASLAKSAGLPPMMAAKMQPWFLSLSMAMPRCAKLDPTISHGLDHRMMEAAEAAAVPIHALEDALSVIGLLSDSPLDEQIADLRSYLTMAQPDPNQLATLSAAYFEERVLEFALIEEARFLAAPSPQPRADRAADMEELMQKMLLGRNAAWMPVIEGTEGNHIVVAVGAMHLPGHGGVLELLSAAGYALARQPLPKATP